jgi:hypothetical protein
MNTASARSSSTSRARVSDLGLALLHVGDLDQSAALGSGHLETMIL